MLYIRFTDVPDNRIKNFEKIEFAEAVKITEEIEKSNREDNKVFSGEFRVLDEDDSVYYKGVFNFGSYDYPNIYQQIMNMVKKIKINKQNQRDKMYLLEQVEKLTPDQYKIKENIDKTLINLDKSQISKLKKWQRITIYSLGGVAFLAFIITTMIFVAQKVQYEKALSEGREQLKSSNSFIKNYEAALLGDDKKLVSFLEKENNLSDSQKSILIEYYLKENQFEKSVDLVKDPIHVETVLLTSNLDIKTKVQKINAFNELYPSNEARFDLAYFSKKYDLMLKLPEVTMTIERSKMKTYALLKLGELEEAKAELNNNNDEEIKQKIIKYEGLKAEIATLQDKVKQLKGDRKNRSEFKKVQDQLDKKNKEISVL